MQHESCDVPAIELQSWQTRIKQWCKQLDFSYSYSTVCISVMCIPVVIIIFLQLGMMSFVLIKLHNNIHVYFNAITPL